MRVRVLWANSQSRWESGQIIEVRPKEGKALIEVGHVEEVPKDTPLTELTESEAAAAEPEVMTDRTAWMAEDTARRTAGRRTVIGAGGNPSE